jgi:hypothetical protein
MVMPSVGVVRVEGGGAWNTTMLMWMLSRPLDVMSKQMPSTRRGCLGTLEGGWGSSSTVMWIYLVSAFDEEVSKSEKEPGVSQKE